MKNYSFNFDQILELINTNKISLSLGIKLFMLQQINAGVVSFKNINSIIKNTRRFPLNNFDFGIQYNPERIKRLALKKPLAGETYLSQTYIKRNFPNERGLPFKNYTIYPNLFPHLKFALNLVINDNQTPQQITEQSLIDVLELVKKINDENMKFFFNSRFAGFSVDHLHFQGFYEKNIAVEQAFLNLDKEKNCIYKKNNLSCYHLTNYTMPSIFVVESPVIEDAVSLTANILKLSNSDKSIALNDQSLFAYNILFMQKNGLFNVFIALREKMGKDNYVIVEDLYKGKPGGCEAFDTVIYEKESDKEIFEKIIKDVSLAQKLFIKLGEEFAYKKFNEVKQIIRGCLKGEF